MRKWLLLVAGAAVLVLLGIGIYQADASQDNQLQSEEDIIDLITSQYPGEISAIVQQADRYQLDIDHEGVLYELIVDGYDGHVIQLIENGPKTEQDDAPQEATAPPEENASFTSEKSEPDREEQHTQVPEESQDASDLKTSIMKHDTKTEEKKNSNHPKKPSKKKQTDTQEAKQPAQEGEASSKQQKNQASNEQPEKQHKEKPKDKQQQKHQEKHAVLSETEAEAIALQEFSGEIEEIALEENDDRLMYHIQVVREDLEADMEIDAYSGEVIYIEIDE